MHLNFELTTLDLIVTTFESCSMFINSKNLDFLPLSLNHLIVIAKWVSLLYELLFYKAPHYLHESLTFTNLIEDDIIFRSMYVNISI